MKSSRYFSLFHPPMESGFASQYFHSTDAPVSLSQLNWMDKKKHTHTHSVKIRLVKNTILFSFDFFFSLGSFVYLYLFIGLPKKLSKVWNTLKVISNKKLPFQLSSSARFNPRKRCYHFILFYFNFSRSKFYKFTKKPSFLLFFIFLKCTMMHCVFQRQINNKKRTTPTQQVINFSNHTIRILFIFERFWNFKNTSEAYTPQTVLFQSECAPFICC